MSGEKLVRKYNKEALVVKMKMKMNGKRRKKKSAVTKQWMKLSMMAALAILVYAVFFWDKNKEVPEGPEQKVEEKEDLLEAIYKTPKFRIQDGKSDGEKGETTGGTEKKVATKKTGETGSTKKKEDKSKPKVAQKTRKSEKKSTSSKRKYYVVQRGDSLWKIAEKTLGSGFKGKLILRANRRIIRNPSHIRAGMKLIIPGGHSTKSTTKSRSRRVAKKYRGKGKLYKVQEEDTLSSIADDHYDNPRKWTVIWKANKHRIRKPSLLREGMTIVIPNVQ